MDILRNGKAEYVDYRSSESMYEWTLTPSVLVRFPYYYNAIHSYADQLRRPNEKDAFYDSPLEDTERAMLTNMGGGLSPLGFYEMKQEIYEIAKSNA